MSLKGNQGKLHDAVTNYITEHMLDDFKGIPARRFTETLRGHGRVDENRVRERTTANNLAWLKRFALSMLKQQDDKYSIAMRRRVAGWNPSYLAKTVGISVL